MADFTLPPSAISEIPSALTAVTRTENRVVQARDLSPSGSVLRAWELEYENQTAAEVAIFDAFFVSKKNVVTFTWINPRTSTTHTVRFVESEVRYERPKGSLHYNFKVTLMQDA